MKRARRPDASGRVQVRARVAEEPGGEIEGDGAGGTARAEWG